MRWYKSFHESCQCIQDRDSHKFVLVMEDTTSIYHLYGLLNVLDEEINALTQERQALVKKISKVEERSAMLTRANLFSDLIKKVTVMRDPVESLAHRNARLEPWRHNLPRKYFENTHDAWKESPPSNWTRAQASSFFNILSQALDRDAANLKDATFLFE